MQQVQPPTAQRRSQEGQALGAEESGISGGQQGGVTIARPGRRVKRAG